MEGEGDHLTTLPGEPPIPVRLRVSARARRMTLRVSGLDGRVTLTRPGGVPRRDAVAFARDTEAWLRAELARRPAACVPELGAAIPVGGADHAIVAGRPGLGENCLRIRPDRPAARQVKAILAETARRRLGAAVQTHAAALGRRAGRITLRDTRSRWGSCSARGDLMFSWRLVMAPDPVLGYVAAHEVAHLEVMDHSAAFWALCERLCPDWRRQRDWLRRHGADLHAWRFDG